MYPLESTVKTSEMPTVEKEESWELKDQLYRSSVK